MNGIIYCLGASDDLNAIRALPAQAALVPEGIELIVDHCLAAKVGGRIVDYEPARA